MGAARRAVPAAMTTMVRSDDDVLVLVLRSCAVTVWPKTSFKEMTTATSGVLARFPWLLPIRNSCELRGLCRHSYFGPRTCGGGETNVIEVSGFSIRVSPSHEDDEADDVVRYDSNRLW